MSTKKKVREELSEHADFKSAIALYETETKLAKSKRSYEDLRMVVYSIVEDKLEKKRGAK